jgi:7,8-dihydropterin-6-yl-methyl-4-(beta-D-ribofuranosyl)aminobenzene 5'-phosphate synthase
MNYFIDQDTQIEDNIILVEGFTKVFPKPESNIALVERPEDKLIGDRFNHELAMLLIENDDIVLFSGWSHTGIVNILDEVKLYSKALKIKATFGGYLRRGECSFSYRKGQRSGNIHKMNTGDVIEV